MTTNDDRIEELEWRIKRYSEHPDNPQYAISAMRYAVNWIEYLLTQAAQNEATLGSLVLYGEALESGLTAAEAKAIVFDIDLGVEEEDVD